MENILIIFIIVLLVLLIITLSISKSLLDTFKEMRKDYNNIIKLCDEKYEIQAQIIKNYEKLIECYKK